VSQFNLLELTFSSTKKNLKQKKNRSEMLHCLYALKGLIRRESAGLFDEYNVVLRKTVCYIIIVDKLNGFLYFTLQTVSENAMTNIGLIIDSLNNQLCC